MPGAVAYAVEVSTTRDFANVVFSTETASTELKWVPPSEDRSYFFRIAGVARSGQRGAFSTPRETGPIVAVPKWLATERQYAVTWRERDPVLPLRWADSPRAAAYEVEITDRSGTRIERTTKNAYALRPTGVGEAQVRVRAISETGRPTAFSDAFTVVVALGPPSIRAPRDSARIVRTTENAVVLKWTSGPARAHEVQLARTKSFDLEIVRLPASGTELPVEVSNFGAYFWRVRAFDHDGAPSPWSATSSFTFIPEVKAPLPKGGIGDVALLGPGDFELSWDASKTTESSMCVAYEVAVSRDADLSSARMFSVGETSTAIPIESSGAHYWRVRAVLDDIALSAWSETVRFDVRAAYDIESVDREQDNDGYEIVVELRDEGGKPVEGISLSAETTRGRLDSFRETEAGQYRARWTTASGDYERGALITVRGPLGVETRRRLGDSSIMGALESLWVGMKVGVRNDLAPAVALRVQLDAMYDADAILPNSFLAMSAGVGFDGRDEDADLTVQSSLRRFPIDLVAGLHRRLKPVTAYGGAGLVLEPYRGVVRVDGFPEQRQRGLLAGATIRAGIELDVRYGQLFAELGYSFISPVEELLTLGGNALTLSVGIRLAPFVDQRD